MIKVMKKSEKKKDKVDIKVLVPNFYN